MKIKQAYKASDGRVFAVAEDNSLYEFQSRISQNSIEKFIAKVKEVGEIDLTRWKKT